MHMRPLVTVTIAALAFALPLRAQATATQPPPRPATAAAAFDFTIANIMRGPELVGRTPDSVRWTPDSRWIYFVWNEPGTDWREPLRPYRVRAQAGARPERLTAAQMDTLGPLVAAGSESTARRLRAVAFRNDLFLVDARAGTVRRLTQTIERESNPRLGVSGDRVYFARDNNAYMMDLRGGLVRQLTNIRTDSAPSDKKPEGQRGFVEREQRDLLESVRDRIRADSIAEAERKRLDSLMAKPLHLKRDERVLSIDVSPKGNALILITETRATRSQQTEVPQFVTKSGYTEPLRVRTKVGDEQPVRRVAHMSLPSGDVKWLLLVQGDTTRPAGSVQVMGWNDVGTGALLDVVSRDNKTRWLHVVSDAGVIRTVDTQRDSAWVARKSFENTACGGCAGWYDGGRRIWLVSEADGWAHLYSVNADGGDRKRLTSGKWEVQDVELSPDRRSFIIHTSEATPFERHAYRLPISGGARERLTTGVGGHTVTLSPDGRLMADVHSTANRPPELFVAAARPGGTLAKLTTSPTSEWLSFNWITPEIVMVPGSDGVPVPARLYRPADLGARPNGAAAIFVHGAGYLHNVHNYWSTYYREYMFNHLLASRGYVVLDIDYRGSAGYGRDWRTAVYRHMGGRDLQDHVDGSKYLQKEFGIDAERIGIYGGSYGGFITLMALFTEPKQFGAGAGLRSVTDWAHYNHPYTSNILNLPQDDSVAYRRSSPIYFAEGLEDPLLIAHGMVDVNVQFQDVVRLAQKLIELGKTDWEMAVYPVEDHAFVRPSSWTDEYRRIFELFERHLPRQAVAGANGDGTR